MFCRYCGNLLADNAHFCTKCGKAVVTTVCTSSLAQNAFRGLMRKGKVLILTILSLFACLGSYAKDIERTVSTGFGSITYKITNVDRGNI